MSLSGYNKNVVTKIALLVCVHYQYTTLAKSEKIGVSDERTAVYGVELPAWRGKARFCATRSVAARGGK